MTSASTPPPTLGGQAPRRPRGHLMTYGVGRTCAHQGCRTTLSRYNDGELCWSHADIRAHARSRPS